MRESKAIYVVVDKLSDVFILGTKMGGACYISDQPLRGTYVRPFRGIDSLRCLTKSKIAIVRQCMGPHSNTCRWKRVYPTVVVPKHLALQAG